MWKSIKEEWASVFNQSKFHIIRAIGILFIPLLYGFVYVFAFWNPFANVDNLDIAVVTSKGDYASNVIAKKMEKGLKSHFGHIEMTMKANNVYKDFVSDQDLKKFSENEAREYNVSFIIPKMDNALKYLANEIVKGKTATDQLKAFNDVLDSLADSKNPQNQINVMNNFKKNYIMAFGIDVFSQQGSTKKAMAGLMIQVLLDKDFQDNILRLGMGFNDQDIVNLTSFAKTIELLFPDPTISKSLENNFVIGKTQMSKIGYYGFGLAPFFITISLWLGALLATFVINPRVYKTFTHPIKRYFAKYFAIFTIISIQATILLLSLTAIGFYDVGIVAWFRIWLSMLITASAFGAIAQAIRWAMPTRITGLLTMIILLVLQMASNGGLFPTSLQSSAYGVLNKFLPASRSINMLREALFDTNWSLWATNMGILISIGVLAIGFGLIANRLKNERFIKESIHAAKAQEISKSGGEYV